MIGVLSGKLKTSSGFSWVLLAGFAFASVGYLLALVAQDTKETVAGAGRSPRNLIDQQVCVDNLGPSQGPHVNPNLGPWSALNACEHNKQ